ncbi:hypothetical protein LTR97_000777 [Elasticomyces elasticus]|uniref:Uncharacterized protein n=1 Tax=Elasticomyces elasticus TaxID=574655 RepID=A0AAN7WFA8_9PEZI|nr:hypothetical protein LTR97_000777 [Elasticomyces elasticus]
MDSSISPNVEKDEMTLALEAALFEGETSDNPVTVDEDNVSDVPVIDLSDDSAAAPVVKPIKDVPAAPALSLAEQLAIAVHPKEIEKLKLAIAEEQKVRDLTKLQAEMFAKATADRLWKPQRAAKTAPLPVESSSSSPPTIKQWPTEEFLYFCRFCSSQQKTATNLRAHMYGTHQLFEPWKTNDLHKCGFCEKRFVTLKAVCSQDKMCARTVNTSGWAPVKVDEMTEQDMADTWCRPVHGTPSTSVMRPNPNFTGTPSKKRRSDDEENTRPTKQMRTAVPAPPHRTMPSHTSSEDDDDVQFVSSTCVNQVPDTLSAPPNVQKPVQSAATVQSMAYTPAGSQHPQRRGACFSAPPFSQEPMHSAATAKQGLIPSGSQYPQQWSGKISGPPYVQQAAYSASTAVGPSFPWESQHSQQPNTMLPAAPYSHGPVQSASTGAQALMSRERQHTQPPNATLPVAPYGQVAVYSAGEALQQDTAPECTFEETCAREGVDISAFQTFR